MDFLSAYLDKFSADALLFERSKHMFQQVPGIPLFPRAPVECDNLHTLGTWTSLDFKDFPRHNQGISLFVHHEDPGPIRCLNAV